jgi:hypothetical protein
MTAVGAGAWASELLRLAATQLWLSTVVAAAAWVLCAIFGKRGLSLQQALWGLVLLRLVLPPTLGHPLGLPPGLGPADPWLGGGAIGIPSIGSAPVRPAGAGLPGTAHAWTWALLAAWGVGFSLLTLRDAIRLGRLRRWLRAAKPVVDPSALARLESIRRRLGIRREVRLLTAEVRVSPFTVGLFRPAVFVPGPLLRPALSSALEAALAHELAHVLRLDAAWVLVERLVQRLYFFHPVAWLASARMSAAREALSDQVVVGFGLIAPREYARGLVDTLRLDLTGIPTPGLALNPRRNAMRIRNVLALVPLRRPRTGPALLCAALVGGLLLPASARPASGRAAGPVDGQGDETARPTLASPLSELRVSLGYDQQVRHPVTGKTFVHSGVDLAAPVGTPVVSVEDGTVEIATTDYPREKAAGTVVVVDHGQGLKSYYAHLGPLAVAAGEHVSRGQKIAVVGMTGVTTGPHLHFEVWRDGRPVDPFSVIPKEP